jgi:hypothetical protein
MTAFCVLVIYLGRGSLRQRLSDYLRNRRTPIIRYNSVRETVDIDLVELTPAQLLEEEREVTAAGAIPKKTYGTIHKKDK